MGKLIFYIVLAILIYWIIKKRKPKQENIENPTKPIEDMVSCTYCNIHLPKSEAISTQNNQYFCCHEHYQQHSSASS